MAALELGGPEFGPDELSDALWKVAEHGQTKATRAAAQRILGPYSEDALRQKGIFVTEEEVAQEAAEKMELETKKSAHWLLICCIYYPPAITLWAFMYRADLRQRRITLRSMALLAILIALGTCLLPIF